MIFAYITQKRLPSMRKPFLNVDEIKIMFNSEM